MATQSELGSIPVRTRRFISSRRWPRAHTAALYAVLCLWFAPDLVPDLTVSAPGLTGSLHERIVTGREPSLFQSRWLVPSIVEHVRQLTGLSVANAYMLVLVPSMWVLLVSFHALLRRMFTETAAALGGAILFLAYMAPSHFFHPYDILCCWCTVVAVEGILRKSPGCYLAAIALLGATKWVAAASTAPLLAAAWFGLGWRRRDAWIATLGSAAVVAALLGFHCATTGLPTLLALPGVVQPPYAMPTHQQFLASVRDPASMAKVLLYLLPGLLGVARAHAALDRVWLRLLWFPMGLAAVAVAARIYVWEVRTYFPTWVVFMPFLLTSIPGLVGRSTGEVGE
jgi:hypothetical protein